LLVGLCALAVTALPWPLASAVATASVAWFAISWVPGLRFQPGRNKPGIFVPLDHAMLVVCLAGLALAALCVAWRFRRPRQAGHTRPRTDVTPSYAS
jgi:hypothetical protein